MEIPDKIFFKIGEVSKLLDVKPHVLRYWEGEFAIALKKSRTGQRLYRRGDIERLSLIKELLYSDGYTISGAKKYLAEQKRSRSQGGKKSHAAAGGQKTSPAAGEAPAPKQGEAAAGGRERHDSAWLEALRSELQGLQALIHEARSFKP